HHERQVRLLGERGLRHRGRQGRTAGEGRHAHRQRPRRAAAHLARGRRPPARRGHRHLRQGRPVGAGRRRAADRADRRADGRQPALDLYDPAIEGLEPPAALALAREAEAAALGVAPEITNSEGAEFGGEGGQVAYASSLGFAGTYSGTHWGLSVSPVATRDGTMQRDSWGVASRGLVVVEAGVLQSSLLDAYSARRLGLRPTGHAARSFGDAPGAAPTNFFLAPGPHPPEAIIGSIEAGLYVTELIGFGVNGVTGDYSRGAAGLWIERGELAYPVEEITI